MTAPLRTVTRSPMVTVTLSTGTHGRTSADLPPVREAIQGADAPGGLLLVTMPSAGVSSPAGERSMTTTRRARGTGQIFQVGDTWTIRYTVNGRRIKEAAGPRRKDAVELLNKRLGKVAEGRLTADAARLMWADIDRIIVDEHQRHRSYEKVERHVKRHLRRHFGGERASAIDYKRLLAFKHARLEEGASASTVRYELSLVRTGLVVAHKADLLDALPPIPHVHVENVRVSFFEDGEFQALAKHLPDAPRAVATFMYWTGWRRNETLTRGWRHVDFDRGTIILEPGETKSGEGRTFPFDVLPELAQLLKQQRAYTDAVERRTGSIIPWVFHREGKRVVSIRQAWRTACKKAGLIGRIPHDFRRSAVRRLERAGVPRSVAKQLVGHRTDLMYSRYAIVSEIDLREGLSKVAKDVAQTSKRIRRIGHA
jgi:integrase